MTVYEYGMGGADDAGFEQPMTFRIEGFNVHFTVQPVLPKKPARKPRS